jgi:hypothetical protein
VLEGEQVRVVFRKYDGSLHWHAWLRWLGEDEHGVWLGATRQTAWQRGSEPPVTMKAEHVSLFPRDGWWVANFNAVPAKFEVYIVSGADPSSPLVPRGSASSAETCRPRRPGPAPTR